MGGYGLFSSEVPTASPHANPINAPLTRSSTDISIFSLINQLTYTQIQFGGVGLKKVYSNFGENLNLLALGNQRLVICKPWHHSGLIISLHHLFRTHPKLFFLVRFQTTPFSKIRVIYAADMEDNFYGICLFRKKRSSHSVFWYSPLFLNPSISLSINNLIM